MRISIIIPVYAVEDYIEDCLTSVFDQTYKNLEYILVDDASPDKSIIIAKEIIKKHKKEDVVKIITHPKNKGLSAARNSGMDNATGEYLFFLDSDDVLLPNCIDSLSKLLGSNPDIIIGNYDFLSKDNTVLSNKTAMPYNRFDKNEVLDSFLENKWPEMAWNKLVRRSLCLEKNLKFKEGLIHEDNLWSFMIASVASQTVICKEKTYLYRLRNKSITQNKSRKSFNSTVDVVKEIIILSQKHNLFQTHPILIDYIINLCYYLYKELVRSKEQKEYIEITRSEINKLLSALPQKITRKISFSGKLKHSLYKFPHSISSYIIELVLCFRKNKI